MAKESSEIYIAGIELVRESATPLYSQLFDQLRAMILGGRLRAGERLPAGRSLAKELGVARVIVTQAYEQLMMEGYVSGKTGAGTFVADPLPEHLLQAKPVKRPAKGTGVQAGGRTAAVGGTSGAELGGVAPGGSVKGGPRMAEVSGTSGAGPGGVTTGANDVKMIYGQEKIDHQPGGRIGAVPFQIGMPALDKFPYKVWQQVGNQVLKDLKVAHLGYEDTLGFWNLRKAIAAYLRIARAVTCEAEQVIVVTGSQQGLNLIVAALLNAGDNVWMEDPGYHGAKAAFKQAGAQLCPVPVTEEGIDVDYGIQHFADAKMAYVTPSHQFPMGYTLSAARRTQFLAWAAERDSWILEDDYDSEFRYEGRPLPSLQGMDGHGRVIYTGTFSKVMFPGMRLAYIVLPSVEMVARFRKLKDNLDRQSPVMEQLMLCAFMEGGYFLRHIRKMRLLYAERQQQLLRLLKKHLKGSLQVHVTPSGMHLICWLPEGIDLKRFREATKREQVAVSFVSSFTLQHALRPAIMLGFTAYTEYRMKQAVERLAACLEEGMKGA